MKLLLLTVTYFPDKKSASFMLQTIAEQFVKLNNSVTVVTFSSSIKSKYLIENINGVKIIRIRVKNPGFNRVKRALIELSYSWRIKFFFNTHKYLEFDAVIYYSPSIFFGKAVKYIKNKWNIPAYLIVRDIFPDWLVRIGQMNKGLIYWFFKYYEKVSFIHADYIGMESKQDINYGLKMVKDREISVEHLHNWYSIPEITHNENLNEILSKTKINIIYGGALGAAQDMVGFLKCLEGLNERNIKITIVGEGEARSEIEKFARVSRLEISLLPMLNRNNYMSLVRQSDIGLVVLDKNLNSNNYPAKSFDYMYSSKPVFAYMNSSNEFGEMIENLDFGYFAKGDIHESLKVEISRLLVKDSRLLKGQRAFQVLEEKFSPEQAALKVLKRLDP